MNRQIIKLAVITILFSQPGTVLAATELERFQAAIRVKYDMKEQAFADNDPTPILEKFYGRDVISVGPDGVTHEGIEGIRPIYNEVVPTVNVFIESYNSHVRGKLGWDWANFHVHPDDAAVAPFTFKMLFLWEKIKGEWVSRGEMYVPGEFDLTDR